MLRHLPPDPRPRHDELSNRYGIGEWREPRDSDRDWIRGVTRHLRLRRTEYVPFVTHEVTHFTHADPDLVDDYGRQMYVTYHVFLRPETEHGDAALLAECSQRSYCRDWAPAPSEAADKFSRHLARRHRSQITVRHFVCYSECMDVTERLPVSERWETTT